jgi:hypothetical protein
VRMRVCVRNLVASTGPIRHSLIIVVFPLFAIYVFSSYFSIFFS